MVAFYVFVFLVWSVAFYVMIDDHRWHKFRTMKWSDLKFWGK